MFFSTQFYRWNCEQIEFDSNKIERIFLFIFIHFFRDKTINIGTAHSRGEFLVSRQSKCSFCFDN